MTFVREVQYLALEVVGQGRGDLLALLVDVDQKSRLVISISLSLLAQFHPLLELVLVLPQEHHTQTANHFDGLAVTHSNFELLLHGIPIQHLNESPDVPITIYLCHIIPLTLVVHGTLSMRSLSLLTLLHPLLGSLLLIPTIIITEVLVGVETSRSECLRVLVIFTRIIIHYIIFRLELLLSYSANSSPSVPLTVTLKCVPGCCKDRVFVVILFRGT